MIPVAAGAAREDTFETAGTDSAEAIGNTGVYVVASQALIRFIETSCAWLVADRLEDGEVTVGVGFDLVHIAPAPIGVPISVRATVRNVEGRLVLFDVEALNGERSLMTGIHSRAAIDLERFMRSAELMPRTAEGA